MVRVEVCRDAAAWDRYVDSQADACNYHRWKWQDVIQSTFGHEAHYLCASSDGEIVGVLPLFSVRSRLFGNAMISLPFFTYGGLLGAAQEARSALLLRASELARQVKAARVELRQGTELASDWCQANSKVTMEIALPSTSDELWKRFSTGLRNKIRKGQKSQFRVAWTQAEGVQDFYAVFAANMRDLGTPVYPKKWFENICRTFPGQIHIMSLWDGNRVVASAFLSAYRDTLELPWSASLSDSRKSYSHYMMYWSFLEWAIQKGYRRLDLGRCTKGSGTYEFKRHWVCQERPLHWYYWLAPGSGLPQARPDNPRYHLAIEMWKRLPLVVANQLGPRIVRGLP